MFGGREVGNAVQVPISKNDTQTKATTTIKERQACSNNPMVRPQGWCWVRQNVTPSMTWTNSHSHSTRTLTYKLK